MSHCFDALAEWMSAPFYYSAYSGKAPHRSGAHHASIAPYGPYDTGEGGTVYLAIQNAREWTRFCEIVLEQPALADDTRFRTNPERVTHRAALDEAIAEVFRRLTAEEVLARLDAADIANARLGSIGELASHPQFTARNRWRDVDSSGGPLKALLPPVVMDGVTPAMAAIPALGQHTDAILGELGFDAATIAAWRAARSI